MHNIIELQIDALADKGTAIGRHGGKAVFVRFAAPGDILKVALVEEKKGWARGEIREIVAPSPLRETPRCAVFGDCGGCAWQHLGHEAEITGKAKSLSGFFGSRLGLSEEIFAPALRSADCYGYRNRLTLSVARSAGGAAVGLSSFHSHRLVEIDSCPVAAREINEKLCAVKAAAASGILPAPSRLLLQVDSRGSVWATFGVERETERAKARKLEAWGREAGFAGIWESVGFREPRPLQGDGGDSMAFSITAFGRALDLSVPVGCFSQANPGVSQALVDLATSLSNLYQDGEVADFYCGSGNFTLPLALRARSVTGVEGDARAAQAADANALRAGLKNVRIEARAVEKVSGKLTSHAHFWLLDPPRSGAPALAARAGGGPRSILYVSCDPATMVRDLKTFQGCGFEIRWVRAADMFPRTSHLEVAALLVRSDAPF